MTLPSEASRTSSDVRICSSRMEVCFIVLHCSTSSGAHTHACGRGAQKWPRHVAATSLAGKPAFVDFIIPDRETCRFPRTSQLDSSRSSSQRAGGKHHGLSHRRELQYSLDCWLRRNSSSAGFSKWSLCFRTQELCSPGECA